MFGVGILVLGEAFELLNLVGALALILLGAWILYRNYSGRADGGSCRKGSKPSCSKVAAQRFLT